MSAILVCTKSRTWWPARFEPRPCGHEAVNSTTSPEVAIFPHFEQILDLDKLVPHLSANNYRVRGRVTWPGHLQRRRLTRETSSPFFTLATTSNTLAPFFLSRSLSLSHSLLHTLSHFLGRPIYLGPIFFTSSFIKSDFDHRADPSLNAAANDILLCHLRSVYLSICLCIHMSF